MLQTYPLNTAYTVATHHKHHATNNDYPIATASVRTDTVPSPPGRENPLAINSMLPIADLSPIPGDPPPKLHRADEARTEAQVPSISSPPPRGECTVGTVYMSKGKHSPSRRPLPHIRMLNSENGRNKQRESTTWEYPYFACRGLLDNLCPDSLKEDCSSTRLQEGLRGDYPQKQRDIEWTHRPAAP